MPGIIQNRRLLLPGSASGPVLVARTIYSDATGKLVLPTEARTTDLYAADHEDVYRKFESGEPAVVGGRVVRNLVSESEDFSGWTTSNATVSGGVSDPDGGSTASTVTATGSNGQAYTSIAGQATGNKAITSLWMRRRTGSGTVQLHRGSASSWQTVTLTSSWQRFTANSTLVNANAFCGVQLVTSGDEIDIAFAQYEDATGRSASLTIPSEYVSSDVGLAVYATENGNSVASNVVTEAVGSALSTAPYVLTTPGATNSCAYSQDLTGTGWSGSATKAQNQTDIFGNSNSAWTVTDGNGSLVLNWHYDLTVSSSTNTHNVRAWIKKTTSASNFPRLGIYISTGGTDKFGGSVVDTDNGSLTDSDAGGPDSASITSDGDFWRVTVSLADNGTGNTRVSAYFYPAINTDASATTSSAATGSCVIDQAEIFLNTSHAVAHALPPIPTSGSAVTTDPTEVSIDWPTGLTENLAIIFTGQATHLGTSRGSPAIRLDGASVDFSVYSPAVNPGVAATMRANLGGNEVNHAVALDTILVDYDNRVLLTAEKLQYYFDGSAGTADTDLSVSLQIPADGKLDIGRDYSGFPVMCKIRDLQILTVPAGISDEAVLAL